MCLYSTRTVDIAYTSTARVLILCTYCLVLIPNSKLLVWNHKGCYKAVTSINLDFNNLFKRTIMNTALVWFSYLLVVSLRKMRLQSIALSISISAVQRSILCAIPLVILGILLVKYEKQRGMRNSRGRKSKLPLPPGPFCFPIYGPLRWSMLIIQVV